MNGPEKMSASLGGQPYFGWVLRPPEIRMLQRRFPLLAAFYLGGLPGKTVVAGRAQPKNARTASQAGAVITKRSVERTIAVVVSGSPHW